MNAERIAFIKRVILVNAAVPITLLGWDVARGRLGANPIEFMLRSTGIIALVFLALSLTITPARELLGLPWLTKLRRMLGLLSFTYACVHVSLYLSLDQGFNLPAIGVDAVTRPFITVGVIAFALMFQLAWTSTNAAIRRLGKRWTVVHRRVYLVAVCAVLHYWLEVKADKTKPLIFVAIFAVLLFYRFVMRGIRQWTSS
jgi:DMSO/TMAO reductase YedYZ heme-binding membrane subunit